MTLSRHVSAPVNRDFLTSLVSDDHGHLQEDGQESCTLLISGDLSDVSPMTGGVGFGEEDHGGQVPSHYITSTRLVPGLRCLSDVPTVKFLYPVHTVLSERKSPWAAHTFKGFSHASLLEGRVPKSFIWRPSLWDTRLFSLIYLIITYISIG